MQASLRFSISDPEGKVTMAGDANGTIEAAALIIGPKDGEPTSFSLRDLVSISEADYRIKVDVVGGDSLLLFNLGYKYEDFARSLVQARNELALQDLLMEENLRKRGVSADFTIIDSSGLVEDKGKCEVRLYETAIVIMPERSDLRRVPFSDIQGSTAENFKVIIPLDSGSRVEFSRLGKELDPLQKGIIDSVGELSAKVQNMLKDVYPEADSKAILRASKYMREGRAARRSDLEAACPGLWPRLERKLAGLGLREEYAFLSSMARAEKIRIGMKRTLRGETMDEYIWFLTPIYMTDGSKGGNAIAFEASSGEDEGRATYFFRIMGRKEYARIKDLDQLDQTADASLSDIARGLMAINFRREPIYLAEEKLYSPEYSRYRYSLLRIPELRTLRERFIGRVVHSSVEQWKLDIEGLLKFNVAQENDALIWKKSDEDGG